MHLTVANPTFGPLVVLGAGQALEDAEQLVRVALVKAGSVIPHVIRAPGSRFTVPASLCKSGVMAASGVPPRELQCVRQQVADLLVETGDV